MPTNKNIPTRISTILETSNEGFWLVDNDEIIIDINPKMCSILGCTRDEALGKSVFRFLDIDNKAIIKREGKIRDSGKPSSYEITFTRDNGEEIPCIVHGSPYYDDDGKRIGSFAMVTDISDRKRSEMALKRSERKYRILFENSPSGIIFVDVKGNIRDLNSTILKILGSPSIEATKELNIFSHQPLVDSGISWAFKNCILSGKPASHEHSLTTHWGKEVYLKYRLSPMRREDGSIEGVLANILDFTENLASEKRLWATHEVYRSAILNAQGVPYRLNYINETYEFFGEGFEKLLGIPNTSSLTLRKLDYMTKEKVITDPGNRMKPDEYNAAFRNGKLERYRVDLKIETPTGATKWLSNSCVPLRDESTGEVTGALGIIQDISDRKHIEMELKDNEEKYRTLFYSSNDAIFLMKDDKFIQCNPRTLEIFGCTADQILNSSPYDFSPEIQSDGVLSKERARDKIKSAYKGEPQFFEWQHKRMDDTLFHAEVSLKRIELHSDPYLLAVVRDVTQSKQLQLQLQQSQKMEAIGQLAGGIAHDFNNMLTVIRGYSDLILTHKIDPDLVIQRVKQIDKACERAEGLTHQLLAFSRKQILKPEVINLNNFITELGKMLKHLIGEDIDLIYNLDKRLGRTKADPSQMEQVIMNLVLNARDAMPGGGKLIFETKNVDLDGSTVKQHPEAKIGQYVLLSISDDGYGMDRETQSHIFEPFFTTKRENEGTGLGLATVYGIIKQSDGFIWVYSEPSHGSTFRIYLPRVEGKEDTSSISIKPESELHGKETILLVEDETDVRMLVRETLEMMEYNVIEATNGKDALDLCEKNNKPIQLVLTDVVMPQMGGPELAKKLLSKLPETKIIFMSGYTEDAIVHKGVLEPGTHFIQKPFTPISLMQKVRDVLDNN